MMVPLSVSMSNAAIERPGDYKVSIVINDDNALVFPCLSSLKKVEQMVHIRLIG